MLKNIALFATLLSLLNVSNASAQQIDTLYLNSGSTTFGNNVIPALRINETAEFDSINITLHEVSELVIVNQDTADHYLAIDFMDSFGPYIAAGDTQTVQIPDLIAGTYRFYSASERGRTLGASTMLRFGYNDLQHFQWNLNEWDSLRTQMAADQVPVDFAAPYVPVQFTINDRTFPNTLADSTAYLAINLGDTIYVSIVNHGFMDQVFHFHGFHVEMLQSSMHYDRVGWIKDTVPFYAGESVIVKLVANQPGEFPIHAHNLIAVTNAGFYPGGMITFINVSE